MSLDKKGLTVDGCDASIDAFLTFDECLLKHLSEAAQGLAGFGVRKGESCSVQEAESK